MNTLGFCRILQDSVGFCRDSAGFCGCKILQGFCRGFCKPLFVPWTGVKYAMCTVVFMVAYDRHTSLVYETPWIM
jgi:hypothetical protein